MPLCTPLLTSGDANEGNFNFGDHLFRAGHYQLAAKAYYQLFYCQHATELNTLVSDDPKLYDAFKEAVAVAANGRFVQAADEMKQVKLQLPPFTEAGYLAGIFDWAAGDHVAARHSWEQTISGAFFPIPDGARIPDVAKAAAQGMLDWSRRRSARVMH